MRQELCVWLLIVADFLACGGAAWRHQGTDRPSRCECCCPAACKCPLDQCGCANCREP